MPAETQVLGENLFGAVEGMEMMEISQQKRSPGVRFANWVLDRVFLLLLGRGRWMTGRK